MEFDFKLRILVIYSMAIVKEILLIYRFFMLNFVVVLIWVCGIILFVLFKFMIYVEIKICFTRE